MVTDEFKVGDLVRVVREHMSLPYLDEICAWRFAVPYEGNEHLILDRKAEPKVTF